MTNIPPMDKQIFVINALAEDNSIRAIERMTGVHRDTIMRLGVRVSEGCDRLLDGMMRDLLSEEIEIDEILGFIGKKERHLPESDDPEKGDVWTFIAVDSDTKIVPCFRVGKRTAEHANAFVANVAGRLRNHIQLSSDALGAYPAAVEKAFGCEVDYGQIIKSYSASDALHHTERKYSPGDATNIERRAITGDPKMANVCTSHIESQNLTVRMHVRRLTRLTNAFSKKLDNFKAAVAPHLAYYNLAKRHTSLRMTPAMAAGVTSTFWSVRDLIEATD
jgi:IS1 family transposase